MFHGHFFFDFFCTMKLSWFRLLTELTSFFILSQLFSFVNNFFQVVFELICDSLFILSLSQGFVNTFFKLFSLSCDSLINISHFHTLRQLFFSFFCKKVIIRSLKPLELGYYLIHSCCIFFFTRLCQSLNFDFD